MKLLYPDRSNINNTKFAVVGTLVDEKIKKKKKKKKKTSKQTNLHKKEDKDTERW